MQQSGGSSTCTSGRRRPGRPQLQDVLFRNRDHLREHGVLVPGRDRQSHFHAAIDLLDLSWGGLLEGARGSWDELVAEILAWPGDVVVSNENLSLADDAVVARVRAALPDHALRVVFSARDLVRQIPAAWQEKVKHFYTGDYGTFVQHLREDVDDEEARRFWQRQTWPDVLERWSRELGEAPTTLVTVPPSGQDPALLLSRFLEAFGLKQEWVPDRSARSNPGLGPVESALLRAVQTELDARDARTAVRHTAVRGALLGRWWPSRPSSGRIALPVEARDWAAVLSAEWVERVKTTDVRVVGELADLVSPASPESPESPESPAAREAGVDPDLVPPDEQLSLAVLTVADALEEVTDLVGQRRILTEERDRLRVAAEQSRDELDLTRAERDRLHARVVELERTRWQAAKEAMVAAARSSRPLGLAYAAYRRTRRAGQTRDHGQLGQPGPARPARSDSAASPARSVRPASSVRPVRPASSRGRCRCRRCHGSSSTSGR